MTDTDSIVDRVHRVRSSLANEGDPRSVQATVDGPCPECGGRMIVDVHADTGSLTCPGCGRLLTV